MATLLPISLAVMRSMANPRFARPLTCFTCAARSFLYFTARFRCLNASSCHRSLDMAPRCVNRCARSTPNAVV